MEKQSKRPSLQKLKKLAEWNGMDGTADCMHRKRILGLPIPPQENSHSATCSLLGGWVPTGDHTVLSTYVRINESINQSHQITGTTRNENIYIRAGKPIN